MDSEYRSRDHVDPNDPAALTPAGLTALSRRIYAAGDSLSLQRRLTTVYRPLYGSFDDILRWIPRGARLLDVGCGTGALLLLAAELCALEQAYGFDTGEASIRIARAANRWPQLHFQCRADVPVDVIRSSDVIAAIDVLHHVPEAAKPAFLEPLLTQTAPGARLIIKDLDPKPRWRALANRMTDFISTRSRVHYLALADLQSLLLRHGFTILHARRFNLYVWSVYLIVACKPNPAAATAETPDPLA